MFAGKGDCSHTDPEDLPLITNSAEFIQENFDDEYISDEDDPYKKIIEEGGDDSLFDDDYFDQFEVAFADLYYFVS